MTTLIWKACVTIAWAAATNASGGYEFEDNGVVTATTSSNTNFWCAPKKYETHNILVRGFKLSIIPFLKVFGPWSGSRDFKQVNNYDYDGSGSVGFPDFGTFIGKFGSNGIGFDHFGQFVEFYDSCNHAGGKIYLGGCP